MVLLRKRCWPRPDRATTHRSPDNLQLHALQDCRDHFVRACRNNRLACFFILFPHEREPFYLLAGTSLAALWLCRPKRAEPEQSLGSRTLMKNGHLILLGVYLAIQPVFAIEPGTPRPAPATLGHACAGCHGTLGHSRGATPSINGKPEAEFVRLMQAFKSGQRKSSIMNRIARGYQDEDFKALAQFFKNQ